MVATVKIRGEEHAINPFSDIHLSTVNKLLNDIGNIAYQTDTGFVLKEIILPTLPPEVIRRTQAGDYIIFLSASELNDVLTEVIKYYYQNELRNATSKGDRVLASKISASLASLDESSPLEIVEEDASGVSEKDSHDSELEQLRKELAQYKNQ